MGTRWRSAFAVLGAELRSLRAQNTSLRDWLDEALTVIAVLAALITVGALSNHGFSLDRLAGPVLLTLLVGGLSFLLVTLGRRKSVDRQRLYSKASWMTRVAEDLRRHDDDGKRLAGAEYVRRVLDPDSLKLESSTTNIDRERLRKHLAEITRILNELQQHTPEPPEVRRRLRREAAAKLDATAHEFATIATTPGESAKAS